jgi:DNA-binding NarL/FixJ family response regulator
MSTAEGLLVVTLVLSIGLQLWLLRQRLSKGNRSRTQSFTIRPLDKTNCETLTPREKEIARLVAQGKRNADIARDLHLSTFTVETHLKHIFVKLGIRSRTELAHLVREMD